MNDPSPQNNDPRSPPRGHTIFRSIFRHSWEDTLGNRLQAIVGNLWLHIHPTRLPRYAIRFRFTLCAGGLTFLCFVITILSGALLLFHYRPTVLNAHHDLTTLHGSVPFGLFLRSIHRYAGDGMILGAFVHMIRVLLTGSYKPPREFNWVLGVLLLVLTLGMAFTGYLLPWDQKGYWATTVGTRLLAATPFLGSDGPGASVSAYRDIRAALLGGASIGPTTLLRFYALHCYIFPFIASLLMALHFWRVRKDGISGPL